jgi:hypothetical protein
MTKKIFWLPVLFLWISVSFLTADEQLAELISQKQWQVLPGRFSDDSYRTLQEYFIDSLSIKFVTYNIEKLTYKAKFPEYAEIGTITYEKKNGKYSRVKIKNQIKPLIFIENFKKVRIRDLNLNIGDARIHFLDGSFYLSSPFDQVLFFIGQWEFSILPSDGEEQITLKQMTGDNQLTLGNTWGIFILTDKGFLKGLPAETHAFTPESPVAPLMDIYRSYFGIQIKQFEEFWYLPFKGEDNLIIFQKDKKIFYMYDFNENLIPDTRLRLSENNKIILNYNALRQTKLALQKADKITKITLNLFYNPPTGFLSGTAIINFRQPASFRVLNLSENLKIKAGLDQEMKGISVIRKGKAYYFLGPDTDSLSFFYQGSILPEIDYTDIFRKQMLRIETIETDKLYFLSSSQYFYPHSNLDFLESKLTVSLPREFSCLASGQLQQFRQTTRNQFQFASPGTKGISLASGQFHRLATIKAKIPIHVFSTGKGVSSKQFHIDSFTEPLRKNRRRGDAVSKYFNFKALKEAFNLLIKTYGSLDLSEINLLLRKEIQEGGVSNKGFIFFHYNPEQAFSQKITRRSPIILTPDPTNHLIHELAHQWWGGLLSWQSFEDVWITEGFAQFSLLAVLEKTLSGKRFARILKQMKRDIYEVNQFGPVIYGKRILDIQDDYEGYQTIVYNKAAFVIFMLRDLLGESEFLASISQALKTLRYRSVTTAEFIRQFGRQNDLISRFLNYWLYKRKIPEISVGITIENNRAHVRVEQLDTETVLPLTLTISTRKNSRVQTLAITRKVQDFLLEEKEPIRSVDINGNRSLVRIRD